MITAFNASTEKNGMLRNRTWIQRSAISIAPSILSTAALLPVPQVVPIYPVATILGTPVQPPNA